MLRVALGVVAPLPSWCKAPDCWRKGTEPPKTAECPDGIAQDDCINAGFYVSPGKGIPPSKRAYGSDLQTKLLHCICGGTRCCQVCNLGTRTCSYGTCSWGCARPKSKSKYLPGCCGPCPQCPPGQTRKVYWNGFSKACGPCYDKYKRPLEASEPDFQKLAGLGAATPPPTVAPPTPAKTPWGKIALAAGVIGLTVVAVRKAVDIGYDRRANENLEGGWDRGKVIWP